MKNGRIEHLIAACILFLLLLWLFSLPVWVKGNYGIRAIIAANRCKNYVGVDRTLNTRLAEFFHLNSM